MKLTKAGVDQLKAVSRSVNETFDHVPNNCAIVARAKKKILGRGKLRTIKMPSKFCAEKIHVYLEVDGYILDNGMLSKITII